MVISQFENLDQLPQLNSTNEPKPQAPTQPPVLTLVKPQDLPHFKLSERELEVLRLVAHGSTNKQIAEMLFISPKTVGRHLESIFSKLELTSRSAATRYALEHHLG